MTYEAGDPVVAARTVLQMTADLERQLTAWNKRGRSAVVADEMAWTAQKIDETKAMVAS